MSTDPLAVIAAARSGLRILGARDEFCLVLPRILHSCDVTVDDATAATGDAGRSEDRGDGGAGHDGQHHGH